ncbi:MAG: hypothetical protein WED04_07805 [Promethearchaeati archaeon SRVP18_Atabeyarchaeia-1]
MTMTLTLFEATRGKVYLALLVIAGLCLIIAPIFAWLTYDLHISQGAVQSGVSVYVTGFGSMFSAPAVSGVSFSFPALQGWWYGILALVIGVAALLVSPVAFRRPEVGGLIGFLLSFVNMPPLLFFLGRSQELSSIVVAFITALQTGGYTFLSVTSYYALGFIIGIIGTALLPLSSILILSNATKLRMSKEDAEKKKQRKEEELNPHVDK